MTPDGRSFTRDLCLGVYHRWKPEQPLLIFTAYLDESGTHGGSPAVTMAGFLGSARQWEVFERKLRVVFRKYGIAVFHGKEFKARSGIFAGWTQARQWAFLSDIVPLIRMGGLTASFSTSLSAERYKAYREAPRPAGYRLDSQYGICFRKALGYFGMKTLAEGSNHKLDLILEQGHKNEADALRIYQEVKASHPVPSALLRNLIFAQKGSTPLLSLADFLAYMQFRRYQDEQTGNKFSRNPNPTAGETVWHHLDIPDASLDLMKIEWEEMKQKRTAEWRAAKANAKASEE